jgi:nucleoid-associated protein YgaU
VAPPPLASLSDNQSSHKNFEPRARLRDEAPRALEFDSRGATTTYTPPPVQNAETNPTSNARSAAADLRSSGLAPAAFTHETTNTATITASYTQPLDASSTTVAPPPWSERPVSDGPRTHVVVDGDSLERLAGRYLDDSSRGNEIYEANRELLASPDLLPIGVELVIPPNKYRSAFEDGLPQSSLAKDPNLRAATIEGTVRIHPVPSAAHVQPRAQLLPPVRAE